jgi:hypothetical protein
VSKKSGNPVSGPKWVNVISANQIWRQINSGQVSLKRINRFMNAEELDPKAVSHEESKDAAVSVRQKLRSPL